MNYRFFSRTRPNGDPVSLFILAVDDENEEMYEVVLKDGELVDTSELMKNIIDGFQDMKEISQEEAMKTYADSGIEKAFNKRFG
jgi:hypothetical protein